MEEVDIVKVTIGKIPEIIYTQYDELLSFPHLYKSINSDFTTPGFTETVK